MAAKGTLDGKVNAAHRGVLSGFSSSGFLDVLCWSLAGFLVLGIAGIVLFLRSRCPPGQAVQQQALPRC